MHLYQQATQAEELAQHSAHSLHQQRLESEQVATAVQQMAATTGEVAQHVQQAAQASQQARQLSGQGQQVADGTRAAIEQLATLISGSSDTVARVAEDSREIGGMVEVIRSIAEQTNLLALNAAIEAARAGDMGRGFAVVADEVRALAQRTGQSTEQIQQLISRLQQTAQAAVDSMRNGQDQAAAGVQRVLDSHLALQGINQAVAEISGMTEQIASAMEEQSSVALQISHSISSIATHTEQASQEAQRTSQLSETLKQTAASQQALVERFNR
jgi:aerotaxis receptor